MDGALHIFDGDPNLLSANRNDDGRWLNAYYDIKNGAERIVIGRPITKAWPNNKGLPQNPKEAVKRTLEEIQIGLQKGGD